MHTCVYVTMILNELLSIKVYSYVSLRQRTRETMLLHELTSIQIFIGLDKISSMYILKKQDLQKGYQNIKKRQLIDALINDKTRDYMILSCYCITSFRADGVWHHLFMFCLNAFRLLERFNSAGSEFQSLVPKYLNDLKPCLYVLNGSWTSKLLSLRS